MIEQNKVLAIIPARSGSKGLPGKNTKLLLGKPLIAWSIEQALASNFIDSVLVTTDSKEIAEIARKYGARVPFLRPGYISGDHATSIDVIIHALDFCKDIPEVYDIIVLLEPTSPLRDVIDIDNALLQLIKQADAESIVGVSRAESVHPAFMVTLRGDFVHPYLREDYKSSRRQDIEEVYFYEGSLYISYIGTLRRERSFYHETTLGFKIPKWKSFEVDDLVDFIIIEALMKSKQILHKRLD